MTEMNSMPPPYSKSVRYSKIPQNDPGQYGPGRYSAYPPAPSPYAPAPPVMQQQSSNTNVVVVGQPSTVPHTTVVHPQPRANEYLALTLVLMVLCFIHGNLLAFLCLVPALICSCVASDHNNAGEYENARQCGQMALCCNICTIIKYVIAIVVVIVLVIVYFTAGFAWLTGHKCYSDCSTDFYGTETCATVCY